MEREAGGWDKAFVLFITVDRLEPGKDSVKIYGKASRPFVRTTILILMSKQCLEVDANSKRLHTHPDKESEIQSKSRL